MVLGFDKLGLLVLGSRPVGLAREFGLVARFRVSWEFGFWRLKSKWASRFGFMGD